MKSRLNDLKQINDIKDNIKIFFDFYLICIGDYFFVKKEVV